MWNSLGRATQRFMKKLGPSIIAHFPMFGQTNYWGTPNGVPHQVAVSEYTPLGLDGYWSMVANGELFKCRIAPYPRSTFFFLKTYKQYTHSMYSLNCCAQICRTSQNKNHFNWAFAQLILLAAMLDKGLTLCCWNLLSSCFMTVLFWQ